MKTLTKEDKENLLGLTKQQGFKVLEALVSEFEKDVLTNLKGIDISNEKDLKILSKNQTYLKGLEDFMQTIELKKNCIVARK